MAALLRLRPAAAVVFALDGILIGAGDTRYLAVAMVVAFVVYLPLVLPADTRRRRVGWRSTSSCSCAWPRGRALRAPPLGGRRRPASLTASSGAGSGKPLRAQPSSMAAMTSCMTCTRA